MDRRLKLQTMLEGLLGTNNVYYQPDTNISMSYPAIVYKLDDIVTNSANDIPYHIEKRYQITYIDRSPTSSVLDKLVRLNKCSFERTFISEGLNHAIYNLYY